jgi:hypothetical protein
VKRCHVLAIRSADVQILVVKSVDVKSEGFCHCVNEVSICLECDGAHHIPGDLNLRQHHCENLTPHEVQYVTGLFGSECLNIM